LLPKVRAASEETFVVADGFSCREQIEQQTHRRALHVAEVMKIALDAGPDGGARRLPERATVDARRRAVHRSMARAAIGLGLVVAASVAGWLWTSRR